jgi:hypothetical protein
MNTKDLSKKILKNPVKSLVAGGITGLSALGLVTAISPNIHFNQAVIKEEVTKPQIIWGYKTEAVVENDLNSYLINFGLFSSSTNFKGNNNILENAYSLSPLIAGTSFGKNVNGEGKTYSLAPFSAADYIKGEDFPNAKVYGVLACNNHPDNKYVARFLKNNSLHLGKKHTSKHNLPNNLRY